MYCVMYVQCISIEVLKIHFDKKYMTIFKNLNFYHATKEIFLIV